MATSKQGELATCGCGAHGWIVERTHYLELADPRYWIEHENDDELHENRVACVMVDGERSFRLEQV